MRINAALIGRQAGRLEEIRTEMNKIRKQKRISKADRQRALLLHAEARRLITALEARIIRRPAWSAYVRRLIMAYLDDYQETADFIRVKTKTESRGSNGNRTACNHKR